MPKADRSKLKVMVSSSVRHKEPMLDQIYGLLSGLGYRVWMSYRGTVPNIPGKSAFETCLVAVERCDIFLGIITPHYGSGHVAGQLGITHRELLKAIELGMPRFMLAHEQVVNARRLLMDLGYPDAAARAALKLRKGAVIIDDMRLIDMYEAATREDLPLENRTDNWVQQYRMPPEALEFAEEQFSRVEENRGYVAEWRARKVEA
ncbi:DUF4062 domain-containing protein [Sphingomonas bacterium]|uniref:DUF4062 domain-containing protein n=1 Tax=Sphingomonas bacterium TaxID=1895847 RepID=UPI001C2CFEFA|nr:DUF4062 domain-containing protein [Sphingomonas bacterium]